MEAAKVGSATGCFTPEPGGFFDGRTRDPGRLDAYIDGFEIRTQTPSAILLQ